MDEAQVLCDRVAIVDGGRVIAEGTPRELNASLGAAHVIEFGLPAGQDGGPDAEELDARLAALPRVRGVGRDGDRWQLKAEDLQETLPALLRFAEEAGVALDSVTSHAATLERRVRLADGKAPARWLTAAPFGTPSPCRPTPQPWKACSSH